MRHVHIHVTGIVQGVGMRPFVYREAMAHGICGWVLNAGDGVHIEAHASVEALDGFVAALSEHAPAAARVEHVELMDLAPGDWDAASEQGFRIVASQDQTAHTTLVSPDIATCDDCLRELFDPADRRFHYPFINCTNCGPRFTIIHSLPYDRAATSMDCFPMCPECAAEYGDPLDRRFHAQPDACFDCGPHITWREAAGDMELEGSGATPAVGSTREASDAIIGRCVELLAGGGIVAIKGLGGFHLACDATNEQAVAELRRRKRRGNKPLAVMVRSLADAECLCHVDGVERNLLAGSIRPIVLLRRRAICESGGSPNALELAPSVAHDLPELGVMLPYTPLQHLLLAAAEARGTHALVMTSGNLSEEPIETDDALAWEHLVAAGIADALLGNNRAILSRYDDSVVRVVDGAVMPVRRARGYAPRPLSLPALDSTTSCVLACGPQQKATVALTREGDDGHVACFVSQHIGDVENGATFDAWSAARARLENLFDLSPAALACDMHPSYLSSQWAREQAREHNLPLIEVQHHHAHIASVMAEAIVAGRLAPDARVLGIAFDGTGAGTDGTIWGGEFLVTGLADFERAAHLRTWALPGGAASVRDARRNAFALLSELGLLEHPGAAGLLGTLDEQTRSVTATMIERGINSPRTSSMGRLFDAAAALGICGQATYEGEPAIELEAAAWRALDGEISRFAGNQTGVSASVSTSLDSLFRYVLTTNPLFGIFASDLAKKGSPDTLFATSVPDTGPKSTHLESSQRTFTTQSHSKEYESELTVQTTSNNPLVLDQKPLFKALLGGIEAGISVNRLALDFHIAIARSSARIAREICAREGIDTVALSGGVFMNRLLLQLLTRKLKDAGLTVLIPQTVPVNDGCIAYGQAAIARARLAQTVSR